MVNNKKNNNINNNINNNSSNSLVFGRRQKYIPQILQHESFNEISFNFFCFFANETKT